MLVFGGECWRLVVNVGELLGKMSLIENVERSGEFGWMEKNIGV